MQRRKNGTPVRLPVRERDPAEREALVVGLTAFVRVMRDGPAPWSTGTNDHGRDSERA